MIDPITARCKNHLSNGLLKLVDFVGNSLVAVDAVVDREQRIGFDG
ncbi:MAG: hypothetical protein ACK56I_22050 [bacterium]